jgi:hypothetical protein
MSKAALVGALIYAVFATGACATGGQNDGEQRIDASVTHRDASNQTMPDAPRVRLDGGTITGGQDAQVSSLPDAASGPFCSSNSQCTTAGQCCVTLGGPNGFCGPGQVVLGQCVPQ